MFFVRFKHSSSSLRWLKRASNDFYTRKAKELHLRLRAAFKLEEIDDKFCLFTKNRPQKIVDLGFAPGAWTQTALARTHPGSTVLGVDILPAKPPTGALAMQANIFSKRTQETIAQFFTSDPAAKLRQRVSGQHKLEQDMTHPEVDVVMSDMYEPFPQVNGFWNNTTNAAYYRMANTTGLKVKDHAMSMDLCEAGLILCLRLLKKKGAYVCKYMRGKEEEVLFYKLTRHFKSVARFKPSALRPESPEAYFVCLGFRNPQQPGC